MDTGTMTTRANEEPEVDELENTVIGRFILRHPYVVGALLGGLLTYGVTQVVERYVSPEGSMYGCKREDARIADQLLDVAETIAPKGEYVEGEPGCAEIGSPGGTLTVYDSRWSSKDDVRRALRQNDWLTDDIDAISRDGDTVANLRVGVERRDDGSFGVALHHNEEYDMDVGD